MDRTFNERIARHRKISGLTQIEVADALGMKSSTYSQKERKGNIDCEFLIKFPKVVDADVVELLLGEKPEKTPELLKPQKPEKPETPVEPIIPPIKPTARELAAIKILRNLPKRISEEIYSIIETAYHQNK